MFDVGNGWLVVYMCFYYFIYEGIKKMVFVIWEGEVFGVDGYSKFIINNYYICLWDWYCILCIICKFFDN